MFCFFIRIVIEKNCNVRYNDGIDKKEGIVYDNTL